MLKEIDEDLITINGMIALGLLAAEHVAPLLASQPATRALLEDALRADWSWLETREPDPGRLYNDYMTRLIGEDIRLRDDPLIRVFHCGLHAHTYAIWSAQGVTNLEQPGTVLSIGNDIAEVDESDLTQCLEIAVEVSPQPELTKGWLNSLIAQMEREYRATAEDFIGGRLRRTDFNVPSIVA